MWDLLVTTIWLQMQSGDWQFPHVPVIAQGVFLFNRSAFMGAAVFRARLCPSSTEATTLFMPASMIT